LIIFSHMTERPTAIVLLSGGLDSTTLLAFATREGFAVHALTFSYGQRHAHEVDAARRIAKSYGVLRHSVVEIDLRAFGGSALTADIPVPRGSSEHDPAAGIPVTYVPARNTIFLSFALAAAETSGADDIFIGVNAVDYSGYPDCRPEFIAAFQEMAQLALRDTVEGKRRIRIRAPLQNMSKAEIIRLGTSLGVDYGVTSSCYDPTPGGEACGECDACRLRLRGFADAGVTDPATYAAGAGGSASSGRTR
jgi:7-cyano-7-deazaguanine synthase